MASSAHKHQTLPNSYGTTAAPPPTPSAQSNLLSTSDAVDTLSLFLHNLPPSLSLPPRLSPPTTTSPPLISFSLKNPNFLNNHLSSFSQLGFFQLTNHLIPSQLVHSAELESLALFDLPLNQKQLFSSKIFPLGYDEGNEDGTAESFCFDGSSSTESTQFSLKSLKEFTHALETIGLEIVDALACASGFDKPLRDRNSPFCSLMWVSEGVASNKPVFSGRFYPYIISLQHQIRIRNYSVLSDSGWVSVLPSIDSVLVTIGDIAQVWSNGKLKKVRGRPVAVSDNNNDGSQCITMTLLVTLPMDNAASISPLLPAASGGGDGNNNDDNDEGQGDGSVDKKDEKVFSSFSFEDYAWRVYHERFLFKDPLNRFRI